MKIVVQDETAKFGKGFCRLYINFCTLAAIIALPKYLKNDSGYFRQI